MTSKVISANLIYHLILQYKYYNKQNYFYNKNINIKNIKILNSNLIAIKKPINIIYDFKNTKIFFKQNYKCYSIATLNSKLLTYSSNREIILNISKNKKNLSKKKKTILNLFLHSYFAALNKNYQLKSFFFAVFNNILLIHYKDIIKIFNNFLKHNIKNVIKFIFIIFKFKYNKLKKKKSIKKNQLKKQLKINKKFKYCLIN